MKSLLLTFLLFFSPTLSQASWFYNFDSGIGIYLPEGWIGKHAGRSTTITGPAKDFDQSKFFLGSDWVNKIKNTDDLYKHMQAETGLDQLQAIAFSGLSGFRGGSKNQGAIYLLRTTDNVIVIRFDLRGSEAQVDEGQIMLGSIEIRTKPIEN